MEVRFDSDEGVKLFNFGKVNLIYGKNGSGKTRVMELLEESFAGKGEYCLVNGVRPSANLFQVIYIDEGRDIEGEAELKSSSIFRKEKLKKFIQYNELEIDKLTRDFCQGIRELYQEKSGEYSLSRAELKLNENKLSKLESILFELELSSTSIGAKEEYYFYQHLERIETGRPGVLLIDNFDRYLDYEVLAKYIDVIKRRENITLVVTSNRRQIIEDIEFDSIYMATGERIDILERAKVLLFERYLKEEGNNMKLEDYILRNEELYSQGDFQEFYEKNKYLVLKELNI